MKRLFIIAFICIASIEAFAQGGSYVVAGGIVETYDNASGAWVRKSKGSSLSESDYVRSAGMFSLRGKRGYSESYPKCDSVQVASLRPLKSVSVTKHGNDVITRNVHKMSWYLSKYSVNTTSDSVWEVDIVNNATPADTLSYKVVSDTDWLVVDNPEGKFTDKVTIQGRIDAAKFKAGNKTSGICTFTCNGIQGSLSVSVSE